MRKRAQVAGWPAWVFAMLLVFAIGTVSLRLWIVRTTYSVHQADREIHDLQLERERVDLKAAAMKSPLKLEALARTRFKLSQPRTDQVVHMRSSAERVAPAQKASAAAAQASQETQESKEAGDGR